MKITDYDAVTSLDDSYVFLIDGGRGTKNIRASNVTKETKLVKVTGTLSSNTTTISNANVTSDMVVSNHYFGTPSAVTGELTVTTSNGSVTITGTISGSTAVTLYLEKCINP